MELKLITCIVERGKGDGIVDEALRCGAQAATIFDARGRGIREKIGVSGMFIKAEKDVVMIVAGGDSVNRVFERVVTIGGLREKGKGFAFIQPVEKAVGFLE
jgi:nitrogen regulatory protein PII